MRFRAIDKDGEPVYGKGKNSFVQGNDALLLNIITRVRSWKGDCFFDRSAGIDYNNLLNQNSLRSLELAVKREILTSKGVVRITAFSIDLEQGKRAVTIKVVIDTIYGQGYQLEV